MFQFQFKKQPKKSSILALFGIAITFSQTACIAPLIGGAAAVGTSIFTDRRALAQQLQDKDIKSQVETKILQTLGKNHPYHVEITVFYGKVLLTGEVTSIKDKTKLNQAIKPIYGIRGVYNEIIIGGNSNLTSRSSDAVITGQIKATFLNTPNLPTNGIKVLTERGVVYLMGVVTSKEGTQAADLASQTSGVVKVIKLLERISESDLNQQE